MTLVMGQFLLTLPWLSQVEKMSSVTGEKDIDSSDYEEDAGENTGLMKLPALPLSAAGKRKAGGNGKKVKVFASTASFRLLPAMMRYSYNRHSSLPLKSGVFLLGESRIPLARAVSAVKK